MSVTPARLLRLIRRRVLPVVVVAALLGSGATAAVADDVDPDADAGVVAVDGDGDDAHEGEVSEPVEDEDAAVDATVSGEVALAAPGGSAAGVTVTALDAETREVVEEVVVEGSAFTLTIPVGSYVFSYVPSAGTNALPVFSGGATVPESAIPVVIEGDTQIDAVVLPLASVVAGSVSISGAARVGAAMEALVAGWFPEDTALSYQWLRGSSAIAGATSSSYVPGPEDAGSSIQVQVSGSSGALEVASNLSDPVTVADGTLGTGAATVSGSARVGGTLDVTTSGWPAGSTLTYRWERDGATIPDATGKSYRLVAADQGRSIRVVVTAEAEGFEPSTAESSAVKIAAGTLSTATPRISGTARVGTTLTVVTGSWTSGTTLSYQWFVDGKAISGQTARTFKPRSVDLGKAVSVRVTGTLAGYSTVAKTSARSKAVVRGTFTSAPTPRISGTARTGQTLRVVAGTWSPSARLSYQWRVDGKAVSGATGSSYKVRAADRGKRIAVTVTGRRDGYSTTSRTSASTSKVLAAFSRTTAPRIEGTVRVGSTLTARTASWSPTASFSYQWYSDGVAIRGATKSKLTLRSAQYGTRITVKITGSRSTYVTTSRTSSQTGKVAAPPASITRDGTYRVGTGIAAGTYVASSPDGCYWERRTNAGSAESGVIMADYWDQADRVVVTIRSTDKYFYTDGCGSWTTLMPRGAQATSAGDGSFAVGVHLKPGTYVTETGPWGLCYVDVATNFSGDADSILGYYMTDQYESLIVTLTKGDAFYTYGCGTWRRVS